jgi:hypothetical protein
MDDVYDKRVYLENHQLSTLKKGNILNYMALMELEGFSPLINNKMAELPVNPGQ